MDKTYKAEFEITALVTVDISSKNKKKALNEALSIDEDALESLIDDCEIEIQNITYNTLWKNDF